MTTENGALGSVRQANGASSIGLRTNASPVRSASGMGRSCASAVPGTTASGARVDVQRTSRAECHEPPKGGAGQPRAGDVRIITTVDEQASNALLDEWQTAARARRQEAVCVRCGASVDGEESDASLALGVVLLLIGNTLVIAALVAAVVWIVA